MARISKIDWINAGIKVLAQSGSSALTLDTLLAELDISSGSFYHHFGSRKGYIDALLDHWEQQMTDAIIDHNSVIADPDTQMQSTVADVLQHADQLPLEVSIRAWAIEDHDIKQRLQRIDKKRIDFGQSIVAKTGADPTRARRRAMALYAVFLGALSMAPPMTRQQIADAYRELLNI